MHKGTYSESITDLGHTNRCHITHVEGPTPHQKTKDYCFIVK